MHIEFWWENFFKLTSLILDIGFQFGIMEPLSLLPFRLRGTFENCVQIGLFISGNNASTKCYVVQMYCLFLQLQSSQIQNWKP